MAGRAPAPILVFDSGLGGLTVLHALRDRLAGADFVYVIDDAAFPYGDWEETALGAHISALIGRLIGEYRPSGVVIACNTASTIVLPPLRAAHPVIPFVGTVPAIKPAVARTRSGLVSVLATPGTVRRDYTKALIACFAGGHEVTLVGSKRLAALAETYMLAGVADEAAISTEIAPAFVERAGRRTDQIALACTHYPLLVNVFRRLAPWPVDWIDPAPAIAEQAARVVGDAAEGAGRLVLRRTSGKAIAAALRERIEAWQP